MSGHKHAAVMLQYGQDAAETETPWERWEYRCSEKWTPLVDHPYWYLDREYRRKPATIRIGDREINAPLRVAPVKSSTFYMMSLHSDVVSIYAWGGLQYQRHWLECGLCFATEEDAKACAEALLELLKERK